MGAGATGGSWIAAGEGEEVAAVSSCKSSVVSWADSTLGSTVGSAVISSSSCETRSSTALVRGGSSRAESNSVGGDNSSTRCSMLSICLAHSSGADCDSLRRSERRGRRARDAGKKERTKITGTQCFCAPRLRCSTMHAITSRSGASESRLDQVGAMRYLIVHFPIRLFPSNRSQFNSECRPRPATAPPTANPAPLRAVRAAASVPVRLFFEIAVLRSPCTAQNAAAPREAALAPLGPLLPP